MVEAEAVGGVSAGSDADALGGLRAMREELAKWAQDRIAQLPEERRSYYRLWFETAIGFLDRVIGYEGGTLTPEDPWRPFLAWEAFRREWSAFMNDLMRELARRH